MTWLYRFELALVIGVVAWGSAWGAETAATIAAAGPWRPVVEVVVDREVWSWNWAAWDQEKIVSVGDYQYTVFWDADQVFVLARRNLRDNTVQCLRLESFRLSSNDPHRNTCLGVSLADGRLHLSWDHHNNPLRYTRTRPGFLTQPPQTITPADIEPPRPIGDRPQLEARVTYPKFFHDARGTLYLHYRLGASGNGEDYLYRYDPKTGSWTRLGKLFSSRGTYAPWNHSTTRNVYPHDVLFDSNNRLHVTWVYREAGGTWASNHDLHYAYSDDGGLTWHNNAGQKIADLARDDPIELADPGIVVRPIPVYSWLINTGCMAIDSRNRPHVVTYKLPGTFRPTPLRHDPPPEVRKQLCFVHYWRAEDGTWHGGEPIHDPEANGYVARPDVVFDHHDNLYVLYAPWRARTGFRCLEARAEDQWKQWKSYALTGPRLTGLDASKHDRSRWQQHGVLSFTVCVEPAGFGILDLVLGAQR